MPVPGLVWATPAQPWRATASVRALAFDGPRALVAIAGGKLAWLDLATGALGPPAASELGINQLMRLDAGHWLAAGLRANAPALAVIDAATLAVTPVPLAPTGAVGDTPAGARVARLASGEIVVVGAGLPLASYDPATWKQRLVIDPDTTWSRVAVDGKWLYATKGIEVTRIDLTTNRRTAVGTTVDLAAAGGVVVLAGSARVQVVPVEGDSTTIVDPDPHPSFPATAVDAAGKRLATLHDGVLRIHALPTGKELARFELGASARASMPRLVFDGDRIAVLADQVVRVVELATGAVTPAGLPPYGEPDDLAVRADGAVLVLGAEVWRMVDGRITAAVPTSGTLMGGPAGELRRFAELDGGELVLQPVDDPVPLRRWKVPQSGDGWLGDDGEVVVAGVYDGEAPARLLRTAGDAVVPIVEYSSQATVADVDVDGGSALVEMHGDVHVVSLRDGVVAPATLRAPGCSLLSAAIQRRGPLALTTDGTDVAVWRRDTGAQVATLHLDAVVERAVWVPDRAEIALDLDRGLALWAYETGELRVLPLPESFRSALSPDGHRLALAFAAGRVALADADALRAAIAPTRATAAPPIPVACPGDDPFVVPPDERAKPDGPPPEPE